MISIFEMNQIFNPASGLFRMASSNSMRVLLNFSINFGSHSESNDEQFSQFSQISSPALMSLRAYDTSFRQSLEGGQTIWLLGVKEWFMKQEPSWKTRKASLSFRQRPPCRTALSSAASVKASSSSRVQTRFSWMSTPAMGRGLSTWKAQQTAPLGMSAAAKRPLPWMGLFRISTGQRQGMDSIEFLIYSQLVVEGQYAISKMNLEVLLRRVSDQGIRTFFPTMGYEFYWRLRYKITWLHIISEKRCPRVKAKILPAARCDFGCHTVIWHAFYPSSYILIPRERQFPLLSPRCMQ